MDPDLFRQAFWPLKEKLAIDFICYLKGRISRS